MKKQITFLLFLILSLLVSNHSFSQDDKGGFKNKFDKADGLLFEENYKKALPLLLDLNSVQPDNANVKFLLGVCYLNMPLQKDQSIAYLEDAVKNISADYQEGEATETKAPEIAWSYLGDAYHINNLFDKAIESYNKYANLLSKEDMPLIKDINHKIDWCVNAKELIKSPVTIKIDNLGDSINTEYPDYAPVVSADEETMIFTSRRLGSTGGKFTTDGQFFEDIYIAQKENGQWRKAKPIGSNINSDGHEATIGLSADGQTLIIYKDDNGDGNIYYSHLDGAEWSKPIKFGSDINTTFWEPSASISRDNNRLFFVSNRPGGYGGRDIYMCNKLPNGDWAKAQLLPANINTPFDEDAPYIHPDNRTLFFSSKGHNSMGGFDIFMSQLQDDGSWSDPVNIGYPINTAGDDVFYLPTPDGKRAYYASYQKDGFGEKDIYMLTTPSSVITPVAVGKGLLTYENSKVVPNGGVVTVIDKETSQLIGVYRANSATGKFVVVLDQGKSYDIHAEASDAYPKDIVIETPKDSAFREVSLHIELKPIKEIQAIKDAAKIEKARLDKEKAEQAEKDKKEMIAEAAKQRAIAPEPKMVEDKTKETETTFIHSNGEKTILRNVFFGFDKYDINQSEKQNLDNLVLILKQYPKLMIDLFGYTDSKGSEAYNQRLSLNRCASTKAYLVSKGIKKFRIEFKAFGKKDPVASNSSAKGEDFPAARALNRRVIINLLNTSYYGIDVKIAPVNVPDQYKVK